MKVVTHLFFFFLARTDYASVASHSHFCSPSLPMQRFQALATINHNLLKTGTNSVETNHSRCQSLDVEERKDYMSSCPNKADSEHELSWAHGCKTLPMDDQSWISDQASNLDALTDYPSSDTQVFLSNFFWLCISVLMSCLSKNAYLLENCVGFCMCFGWK